MKRQHKTILLVVIGLLIACVIVGVGLIAWFFTSAIDSTTADDASAAQAFDEVRERFAGVTPVFDIGDTGVVLLRTPPDASPSSVRTVHVLAWEPDDETLSRMAFPMWLLRMSDDPIQLQVGDGITLETGTDIRPEDIERYGPTLVVDHAEPDGRRVLVWTD